MIGSLAQIAKAMARYEASRIRRWDMEKLIFHRLCDNPVKMGNVPRVAVLDLDRHCIRIQDYKDYERYKYLYALSTGNRAIGPSWLLDFRNQKSRPDKSRREIIIVGIEKIKAALASLEAEGANELSSRLDEIIKDESNELFGKLEREVEGESLVLLTVMWDKRFPGEREELRKKFMQNRIFGERRGAAKGVGSCAVCMREGEVRSAVPFRFFTVEKSGFSPMGREEEVWKSAPVCEECARWLYIAESYLEENLRTQVVGKFAYLIPDLEPGAAEIEGSFIHFLWEWRKRSEGTMFPKDEFPLAGRSRKAKPRETRGDGDQESSASLFEGLVEEFGEPSKNKPAPFRSASLVFYQPGQKFMLLYTIPEILPTSLRRVKERLQVLRAMLRPGVVGNGGDQFAQSLRADLEFVGRAWKWPRAGRGESQGTLKLTPMHLAEAILTDRRPPEPEFWRDADNLLRATYQEAISSKDKGRTVQSALTERVRLIWATWALIYRSTELEGGIHMEMLTTPPKSRVTPEFWENFFNPRLLLDSPAKRAAFLVGVLFGGVESKQRAERHSKYGEMPIVSRLRGLAVSRDEIMVKIFPELMLKLRQLDANTQTIQVIQQAAADFASQGGELSDEEARFCFCLGWALSWTTVDAVGKTLGAPAGEEAEEAFPEEEIESES